MWLPKNTDVSVKTTDVFEMKLNTKNALKINKLKNGMIRWIRQWKNSLKTPTNNTLTI